MLGLAFSGGRDSLACWYLLRHLEPLVIWVNTGKGYPETLGVVERVRRQCKYFLEVEVDQEAQIAAHGLPADVVPIDCTALGMMIAGPQPVKVQSYLTCCYENISRPLFDAAKKAGVTELIYGQRSEDAHKAPAKDGDAYEGIVRRHPIESWTRETVMAYLSEKGDVPAHFTLDHSSMDCYDCTAFWAHSADRAAWSKAHTPELYERWQFRMTQLKSALTPAMEALQCL